MTEERKTQIVVPDRPQVGDMGLSFQWTDTITDHVERLAKLGGDFLASSPFHYCKLTAGSLKPSGAAQTSPQTQIADVFGRKKDLSFVDTGHNITITNRTNGYFYQNSFVWVAKHPQSGEWHIIWPQGHTIYGKFNADRTADNAGDFSVYYFATGSPGTFTDTTQDILTTDPSPVYNVTGSTILSTQRVTASLDPRTLVFLAGPLTC